MPKDFTDRAAQASARGRLAVVSGLTARGPTGHASQDLRAPQAGVISFFEHEAGGAFAANLARAPSVERSRGGPRIVGAVGQLQKHAVMDPVGRLNSRARAA